MIWKFINTGFHTGIFNMSFDEDQALRYKNNNLEPTLRVYGWHPHAISIGYNQNIDDFDTGKLQTEGIDIVRRPTGGRAILHADELTYSVVMNINNEGPRSIYRFINEGLLRGLNYLGVCAEMSDYDPDFRQLYASSSSIPCFSSSAKNEIQFEGRKLVGSAQRRFGPAILQHGSILLGPVHKRIVDFLAPHVLQSRPEIREDLSSKTVDIKSILSKDVSFEDVSDAVVRGFADQHGIIFEETEFTEPTYQV